MFQVGQRSGVGDKGEEACRFQATTRGRWWQVAGIGVAGTHMLDRSRAFELRYTDPLLSAPSQQLQTLPSSLAPFACGCIIKIKRARTPINTRSVLVYTACVVMCPRAYLCWLVYAAGAGCRIERSLMGCFFFLTEGGRSNPSELCNGQGRLHKGWVLLISVDRPEYA